VGNIFIFHLSLKVTGAHFLISIPKIRIRRLCLVGGSRNVSSASSPVDVDVFADLVLVVGVLWLDMEGVGTEVITLSLEKVGWEVLGAVTIEPVLG
jgi:hypothetical protein